MSKIVCDVCGSSYSDTELQCPICGTVRSNEEKPIVEPSGEEQPSMGGKFSKSNNKKTGSGVSARMAGKERNENDEQGQPSNVAMIIIVGVLLVAILAVCIFIFARIFDNPEPTAPDTTPSTSSTAPTVMEIPCTGLELVGNAERKISFNALTQSQRLNVKALPENTTDTVTYTYTSSNPSVVKVDETGLVTPVANGTATITISYGTLSIVVDVTCDIPAPITELNLKHTDVTLSPNNGLTVILYDGEIDVADIEWSSSNETVALVANGKVTAVGNGNCVITATYGDLSATCKVIVKNMDAESVYVLSCTWGVKNDVTMNVGETILVSLINKLTGEVVTGLQWTNSNDFPKCCTIASDENGIKVTSIATTYTEEISGNFVYVQTEYEGKTYRFTIRIKAPQTEE